VGSWRSSLEARSYDVGLLTFVLYKNAYSIVILSRLFPVFSSVLTQEQLDSLS